MQADEDEGSFHSFNANEDDHIEIGAKIDTQ